jgi:hypothetical protein
MSVVCCEIETSATRRSPVQKIPTDCGHCVWSRDLNEEAPLARIWFLPRRKNINANASSIYVPHHRHVPGGGKSWLILTSASAGGERGQIMLHLRLSWRYLWVLLYFRMWCRGLPLTATAFRGKSAAPIPPKRLSPQKGFWVTSVLQKSVKSSSSITPHSLVLFLWTFLYIRIIFNNSRLHRGSHYGTYLSVV